MTRAAILATVLTLAGCAQGPALAPGALAVEAARYTCDDGAAFTARFDPYGEGAVLTFEQADPTDPDALPQDRKFRIVLGSQQSGSGIWYAGSGWSLRGQGQTATLTRPDGRAAMCRWTTAGPDTVPQGGGVDRAGVI